MLINYGQCVSENMVFTSVKNKNVLSYSYSSLPLKCIVKLSFPPQMFSLC